MKRLLYKIRIWLLGLLNGEPEECAEKTKDAYMAYIREQREQISMLVDQCACDCDNRNGWCNDFEPVSYGK